MSDSVRPHRRQPTRLPHPWDSPGKNTGVGCHFLLHYIYLYLLKTMCSHQHMKILAFFFPIIVIPFLLSNTLYLDSFIALAWKIPWTEEPGRLQSMGSLRVRHDWATSLSLFLSSTGEGNSNPLQCSCLENPRDGGAWWAAVYGVTQSQTWLKRLSSSSSSSSSVYMSILIPWMKK